MSRKCKSISFDLDDEFEIELLNHAEMINQSTGRVRHFSRYVKELIKEDLKRGQSMSTSSMLNTYNQSESISDEVKQDMSSFF